MQKYYLINYPTYKRMKQYELMSLIKLLEIICNKVSGQTKSVTYFNFEIGHHFQLLSYW